MQKTTVYLTDELSQKLAWTAQESGRSAASLIREGVAIALQKFRPKPRAGIFNSGQPDLARNFDKYLKGFGER